MLGEVRQCTQKSTGQVRAVKCFRKDKIPEARREAFLSEIGILKALDHPTILKLFEVY